jgi:hypothetical protein
MCTKTEGNCINIFTNTILIHNTNFVQYKIWVLSSNLQLTKSDLFGICLGKEQGQFLLDFKLVKEDLHHLNHYLRKTRI